MLNVISRLGISRGLMSGNKFMGALGAVAMVIKIVKKVSGSEPKTIYTRTLKPGESLVISDPRPKR